MMLTTTNNREDIRVRTLYSTRIKSPDITIPSLPRFVEHYAAITNYELARLS